MCNQQFLLPPVSTLASSHHLPSLTVKGAAAAAATSGEALFSTPTVRLPFCLLISESIHCQLELLLKWSNSFLTISSPFSSLAAAVSAAAEDNVLHRPVVERQKMVGEKM